MCDFIPGEEIICVDASAGQENIPNAGAIPNRLIEGKTYILLGIAFAILTDEPRLQVHPLEIEENVGWRPERFRRPEIIEYLPGASVPIKVKVQ